MFRPLFAFPIVLGVSYQTIVAFSQHSAVGGSGDEKEIQPNFCKSLLQSIQRGNIEYTKALIVDQEKGSRNGKSMTQCRDGVHRCALSLACSAGYVELAQLLHDAGYSINSLDKHNLSPLSYASWKGQIHSVKFLLEKGANIFHRDDFGVSPIHKAAAFGHSVVMEQLLKEVHFRGGQMALLRAVNFKTGSIMAPTEYNAQTLHQAPLHLVYRGAWHLSQEKREEMLELLIAYGADPNIQDKQGNTPLHYASALGYVHSILRLLQVGADCRIQNKDGERPSDMMGGLVIWKQALPWVLLRGWEVLAGSNEKK